MHQSDGSVSIHLGLLIIDVSQLLVLDEVLLKEFSQQAILFVCRAELLCLLELTLVYVLGDGLVEILLSYEQEDLLLVKPWILLDLY